MAATRLQKVEKIFQLFDVDGDGGLDRTEIAALFQAVDRSVRFTAEQTNAVIDEIFRTYGDLLGRDNLPRLTLDALRRSYDDGASDVDRDFDALGLGLDDGGAASTNVSVVLPPSKARLPPLPRRPRQRTSWRLGAELEGLIRRLRRQRIREGDKVKAAESSEEGLPCGPPAGVVSSPEMTGEPHPVDDEDASSLGDGGVSPSRASSAWERQPSLGSSLSSSSFCSVTDDISDLDYGDRPRQSEWEEIPSFRWLSPSLLPQPPEPEEVNWEKLIYYEPPNRADVYAVDVITDNKWVVLGLHRSSGKRCCLVLDRGLKITWRDNRSSWRYTGDGAELSEVCWLDIRAQVSAGDLSPGTAYVCLLVFDLSPRAFGLGLGGETQTAFVSLGSRVWDRTVRLQPASDRRSGEGGAGVPRRRKDGWMEMVLGELRVGEKSRGKVVGMGVREVERLSQPKGGLLVRGVELRPKNISSFADLIRVSWPSRPADDDY